MNNKQISNKKFDLEERTLIFSSRTIELCKNLRKDVVNSKLIDQLIRSSTSIGANYIEANDSLGKRDFVHRLRIARKETKETIYWLKLLLTTHKEFSREISELLKESFELKNILSAIINKVDERKL